MTLPFEEGAPVSYEAVQRWEHEARENRLKAAVKRVTYGETNWESLTHEMGRNELPDLLALVSERLPQDQLIVAVGAAWSSAEFPEQFMPRRDWLPIFQSAGYHDDDQPAIPPDNVTLWRGGTKRTRMAWTAEREQAEWFQRRFNHLGASGKLWTVTVGPDRLLAHYHHKHRREDEYVIDPTGLRPREVR